MVLASCAEQKAVQQRRGLEEGVQLWTLTSRDHSECWYAAGACVPRMEAKQGASELTSWQ